MANGGKGWKTFGIVVIATAIVAAIAVLAFLVGRGCESNGKDSTTTTRTRTAETTPAPASAVPEEPSNDAGAETVPAAATTETPPAAMTTETTATTARYVVGEGEGETPCVDGLRTRTRTVYYSDGSTDTTTITEPCTP